MKAVGPFEVPHLDDVERTWGEVFASAGREAAGSTCLHAWASASSSLAEAVSFGEFLARATACGARLPGASPGSRVVFLSHPSVAYYVAACGAFVMAK